MDKTYVCIALIRVILTCLPQNGYIHPDEFFQSIEIVAERSLQVQVDKPWEFNVTFPIRSVTLPYLTIGSSFQLLKFFDMFLSYYLGLNLFKSYFILVFPRLLMCGLSFLVDWSLYKICSANSEKYKSRLLILSTSYVMLVYATRTFSNTIELILFSLLLYYVSESVIFSNINVRQREYLNKRYNNAKTTVERAKFHKLRLYLENDSLRNYFIIASISAMGFFNRPTFIIYGIGPVFFWLYRGIGFKSIATLQFHLRTIVFVLSTVPMVLMFILIDSFYFGYLTWGEIGVLRISLDNFVVTPFNFIKYNINPNNLALHGLHPRFLHALVNVPLLFNLLGLFAYLNLLELILYLIQSKYNYLPSIRSIKGLMTTSFVAPLAILSIFPHQEPRFLIPLMLPLVYLYGSKILSETDVTVMRTNTLNAKSTNTKKRKVSRYLLKIWIVINIALTIFYGFIHQGGIWRFISHLNNEMQFNRNAYYDVVTSHIYSVPHSLLNIEAVDENVYLSYAPKRMLMYQKGSESLEKVVSTIVNILKIRSRSKYKYKLYLLIPFTLYDNLQYFVEEHDDLVLSETVMFYPHFSTEAMPLFRPFDVDTYLEALLRPVDTFLNILKSVSLIRIEYKLK